MRLPKLTVEEACLQNEFALLESVGASGCPKWHELTPEGQRLELEYSENCSLECRYRHICPHFG